MAEGCFDATLPSAGEEPEHLEEFSCRPQRKPKVTFSPRGCICLRAFTLGGVLKEALRTWGHSGLTHSKPSQDGLRLSHGGSCSKNKYSEREI